MILRKRFIPGLGLVLASGTLMLTTSCAAQVNTAPAKPAPANTTVPLGKPGESITVDLSASIMEGAATAPATLKTVTANVNGATLPALEMTAQGREARHALFIPINVDGETYNTLQFKAKLASGANPDDLKFDIWLLDHVSNWCATSFRRQAKPLGDGWYQFSWDMVYAPDNGAGIEYSKLKRLSIRYPYALISKDQPHVILFADMKFVSGMRANTGDPARFEAWQNFVAAYKPDYSDSSIYLQPPAAGRLAKSIPFVKNGKALGQIVVPQGASAPVALAGAELGLWLGKITSAQIPLGESPIPGAGPKILIGRKFAEEKFKDDIAWLQKVAPGQGTDGFAVRNDKDDIYIFGATDKGTMNGVFAFLENNTDIIWPRGLVEQSAVFTQRSTLDIAWANGREIPATALRGWSTNGRDGLLDWQMRNRSNYVAPEGTMVKSQADDLLLRGNAVQFGGGHNISYFLGKNPAFYPVIDGKQVTEFNIWKHQPNFTAPGITDAVAQNMIQYIKEKMPPGIDCVNINIEDNWGLSTDPRSLAPIKLPDGSTITSDDPAFRSTQFFIFLNDVTKKVRREFPNITIGTYAYFFSATVPKVAVDPNIRVFFAPYPRKDYRTPLYSPINNHWWRQLGGWSKNTSNLVAREYYGIFNGIRPLAEVVAEEIKAYRAHGITRFTAEMFGDTSSIRSGALRGELDEWNFLAMEYWVINRLYWNPDQDVEQLRKYYLRRTYQEAAPHMEKFFGAIRANWFKGKAPMGYNTAQPLINDLVVRPGIDGELRQELDAAARAAKNPTSRLMVNTLRLSLDKWVEGLKAMKPKNEPKPKFKFSPEMQLRFGWNPVTDWTPAVTAWAQATHIDVDGNAVPAVRLATHAGRLAPTTKEFTVFLNSDPGSLLLKDGDALQFTIRPEDKARLAAPLSIRLQAVDKGDGKLSAPAEAIQKQPDGSLRVNWAIHSAGKFKIDDVKQIVLYIPREVSEGHERVLFYLTDLEIKRN